MRKLLLILTLVLCANSVWSQIKWNEVAPGVWKGIIGTPESLSLLSAAECQPKLDGLNRLPKMEWPDFLNEFAGNLQDGKTVIRVPLIRGEQLYGLGLNFKTIHQRGRILNLRMDHYGGRDNGRTHAPVPFYVSSEGYGVLINSSRYIQVYAGVGSRVDSKDAPVAKDRNSEKGWTAAPYSDAVSILVPALGAEIYYFCGPTQLDVIRRYNLFCGGGVLPPRWGLGFTYRTHTKYSAEQVCQEVEDFEKNGFPLDFVGLEPGWQSKAYPCSFEWDNQRFPKPDDFVMDLQEKRVRVNLWTNPYVSPSSAIYNDIRAHSGSHTVWCGLVPDLYDGAASAIIKEKFGKEHVSKGVAGYKIDEIDGYDEWLWPDVTTFPSGVSAEQMRQTYGLRLQKLTFNLFQSHNQRTYGLTRASNAGASYLPYVLYNDYYNHKDYITALINSGYCGVLWTPEVRSAKSSEEWLRRIQTVVFSPMAMLDGWSSGTKPWSFVDVTDEVRKMALLRMQMMPYWYTEFARYCFDGIPPFRAMNTEEGFNLHSSVTQELTVDDLEANPYLVKATKEIKDQYMAGEYLLVAPMFTGEKSREVVLPKGKWYDFYTGEYVGNGEIIEVNHGIDKIPVFVKDGGIIPMTDARMHAPKDGEKINLEIRHYGEADGTYYVYDDDGETFDYVKGEYSWRKISVTHDNKGRLVGKISKAEKGKPDNFSTVSWKFMSK